MAFKYQYLDQEEKDSTTGSLADFETGLQQRFVPSKGWMSKICILLVACSFIANGFSAIFFLSHRSQQDSQEHKYYGNHEINPHYAKGDDMPETYKQFWWNTAYSSHNETEKDELWNAILPSHGFVAIDRKEAEARNWPESMYLPSDHSKGVYLLEAYHQLHCLKILRLTMREAVNGLPFTYPPGGHVEHCFDTLRQSTMCNADSTPLYTFGDNTAGVGQYHKCRDWNALRDYATKNQACYRDTIEDVLLGEHFGYCDNGDDGLIVDAPPLESITETVVEGENVPVGLH